MRSYHSGPRPHLCPSQTAEGCTPAGSCPAPTHTQKHRQEIRIFTYFHSLCPQSHRLTLSSTMSSLSSSGSQASPCPSLSRSSCPEFGSVGQLSCSQSCHSLKQSHPTTTLRATQMNCLTLIPFDSDRWHSACRVARCLASRPDQSRNHTGSHRPQTRQRTRT